MVDRMNLMDAQQLDRIVKALGFVDIQDLLRKADVNEMNEAQQKDYYAKAKFLQPMVKREFAIMLAGIIGELARKMESVDQGIFWRGGINIIDTFLDRVQELVDRDTELNKPEEPPKDPHQVISETGDE